jgi:hypothetical protein
MPPNSPHSFYSIHPGLRIGEVTAFNLITGSFGKAVKAGSMIDCATANKRRVFGFESA